MGSVGGLLGVSGGAGGTGFAGPAGASIMSPVSQAQAETAYNQTQQGLQQQQALLQALQQQGGLQNQSQVYNQLQNVAAGQGPNPAKAQLAQATGANTANQAALMAGQRGASQNAGLIARQAAMQGGANQQNAAGQAATMQAQQSLNALSAAGNMATTQAGQQIGATSGYSQAAQNEQANLLNSIAGVNSANVGMQSNINNVNGQLANTQLQGQQAMLGGMMNSMGGMGGMLSGITSVFGGAHGGKVVRRRFDDGGDVSSSSDNMPSEQQAPEEVSTGSDSSAGEFGAPTAVAAAPAVNASTPSFGSDAGASALAQGMSSMGGGGGKSGGGGGGGGIMSLLALMADGGEVRHMYADPSGPVSPTDSAPTTDSGYTGQSKFGNFLHSQKVKAQNTPTAETPKFGNPGADALYKGIVGPGKQAPTASPSQATQGTGMSTSAKDYKGYDASGFTPEQMANSAAQTNAANMGGLPAQEQATQSSFYNPTPADEPSMAKGGKVPALLSPGEIYLTPKKAKEVAKEGKDPIKSGKKVPGKPKYPGNDYRNDVVKANLDEGGLVIPNKVMQSPNAHWEALKFVRNHIKSKK